MTRFFITIVLLGFFSTVSFYWFWPQEAQADPIVIFSDNFDQSGNGLKNGWAKFGDSSVPGRKITDSPNSFVVGLDGTKGILFEGANASDSDDGAERNIATMGYTQFTVEYSRTLSVLENGESFKVEYSLDGDSFVTLETLTASQSHTSVEFSISNPNRNTKLTLRFYINGNSSNDRAGIDNLIVNGEEGPLFYDGFESGDFDSGNWNSSGNTNINHDDADYGEDDLDKTKIWTDDNDEDFGHDTGFSHDTKGHGAELIGDGDSNLGDGVLIKSLNLSDYKNMVVRYARRVSDLEAGELFGSYYSPDGGNNWFSLETINGASGDSDDTLFESVIFDSLSEADNAASFSLKFEINANSGSDNVFIDNIVIWGEFEPASDSEENGSEEEDEESDESDNEEDAGETEDEETIIILTDSQILMDGNMFVPEEGTTLDLTTQLIVVKNIEIKVSSLSENKIFLNKDTIISRVDNSAFDSSEIIISEVGVNALAGLTAGSVVEGMLQWGIPNVGLQFSSPITVTIFVGTELNGRTLTVIRSTNGLGDWTSDGIVEPATCSVSGGLCVFQATKASYYAVTSGSGSSSDGSSSGGGGGGAPGSIILDGPGATPIPILVPTLTPTTFLNPTPSFTPTPLFVASVTTGVESSVDGSSTETSGLEEGSLDETNQTQAVYSLSVTPKVSEEVQEALNNNLFASFASLFGLVNLRWLLVFAIIVAVFTFTYMNRRRSK